MASSDSCGTLFPRTDSCEVRGALAVLLDGDLNIVGRLHSFVTKFAKHSFNKVLPRAGSACDATSVAYVCSLDTLFSPGPVEAAGSWFEAAGGTFHSTRRESGAYVNGLLLFEQR
eukprot:s615_g28.t1